MMLLDFCNAIMDGKIDECDTSFLLNGVVYFPQAHLSSRCDRDVLVKCWKEVEGEKSDYTGLYNRKEFFIKANKNIIPVNVFIDGGKIKAIMRILDKKIIWYEGKWYL